MRGPNQMIFVCNRLRAMPASAHWPKTTNSGHVQSIFREPALAALDVGWHRGNVVQLARPLLEVWVSRPLSRRNCAAICRGIRQNAQTGEASPNKFRRNTSPTKIGRCRFGPERSGLEAESSGSAGRRAPTAFPVVRRRTNDPPYQTAKRAFRQAVSPYAVDAQFLC